MNQASVASRSSHAAEQHEVIASDRLANSSQGLIGVTTISVGVAAADFISAVLLSFLSQFVYHQVSIGWIANREAYLAFSIMFAVILVTLLAAGREYRLERLQVARSSVTSGARYYLIAFAIFISILFLSKATDFYSRGGLVTQFAVGLSVFVLARASFSQIIAGGVREGKIRAYRIVLVGTSRSVNKFRSEHDLASHGVWLTDVFTVRDGAISATGHDDTELSRIATQVEQACRESRCDEIVVTLPLGASAAAERLAHSLAITPIPVRFAPDSVASWFRPESVSELGSATTVQMVRRPLGLFDRIAKRTMDIVIASTVLVIAGPLMLVIAALIKLDSSGPVLFRQQRHGFNNNPFRIFKFRTMTTMDDGAVVRQAQRNDTRITRVGAILRRTNLDELPQILNVLSGEMSLVGPRPHALAHNLEYEKQIALYARRHNVKPGITGWAQVSGFRGETDTIDKMEQRVQHDLFYIDHWSLFLDLKILVLTVVSPKAFKNAY